MALRQDHEPDAIVLYGPKLPLEKGRYSAEIVFESQAPNGLVLGQFNIRRRGDDKDGWAPVVSGSRAVADFEQKDNVTVFVCFQFQRAADMTIRSVLLTRRE